VQTSVSQDANAGAQTKAEEMQIAADVGSASQKTEEVPNSSEILLADSSAVTNEPSVALSSSTHAGTQADDSEHKAPLQEAGETDTRTEQEQSRPSTIVKLEGSESDTLPSQTAAEATSNDGTLSRLDTEAGTEHKKEGGTFEAPHIEHHETTSVAAQIDPQSGPTTSETNEEPVNTAERRDTEMIDTSLSTGPPKSDTAPFTSNAEATIGNHFESTQQKNDAAGTSQQLAAAQSAVDPSPSQQQTSAEARSSPPKASTSAAVRERPSGRVSSHSRSRADDLERQRHDTEDMRLMWLSLPSHDHPSYYSDTDDDASSTGHDVGAALQPRSAAGRAPYLAGRSLQTYAQIADGPSCAQHHDDGFVSDEEENDETDTVAATAKSNASNRGNKLRKGARWVRVSKLGTGTEAKSEKDIQERFTARLRALQRTQVENMLESAGGPSISKPRRDLLHGSDCILQRDVNLPPFVEESSTLLAPQLLRPILSARALLESHTLRHTFRNPHIGALSRTALDLRESEGQLSRSLSRCLGAMEKRAASTPQETDQSSDLSNGQSQQVNGGRTERSTTAKIDVQAIGVEGTHGTEDELNPSFAQLDRLFITKEGLLVPIGGANEGDGTEQQETSVQSLLTAAQQRDITRAALECLHELGADSLEYVERLDEVRSRLAAVKRKRLEVWNALRIWALRREGDKIDHLGDADEERAAKTNVTSDAGNTKGNATSTGASSRKRQRV
jgi:hypothetical protein